MRQQPTAVGDDGADQGQDNADVELLGRIDAHADVRGFRVDPARVRSALAGCPGVRDVTVALHRDERGEPRLVAYVAADGDPPTVAQLRAFLWTKLPGYAKPSAIVVVPAVPAQGHGEVVAGPLPPSPAQTGTSPAQSVLTRLWAEALGVERVAPAENYWQAFSFLEVLARARDIGMPVAGQHVSRNRTVEALAADLAASRIRHTVHAGGNPHCPEHPPVNSVDPAAGL